MGHGNQFWKPGDTVTQSGASSLLKCTCLLAYSLLCSANLVSGLTRPMLYMSFSTPVFDYVPVDALTSRLHTTGLRHVHWPLSCPHLSSGRWTTRPHHRGKFSTHYTPFCLFTCHASHDVSSLHSPVPPYVVYQYIVRSPLVSRRRLQLDGEVTPSPLPPPPHIDPPPTAPS